MPTRISNDEVSKREKAISIYREKLNTLTSLISIGKEKNDYETEIKVLDIQLRIYLLRFSLINNQLQEISLINNFVSELVHFYEEQLIHIESIIEFQEVLKRMTEKYKQNLSEEYIDSFLFDTEYKLNLKNTYYITERNEGFTRRIAERLKEELTVLKRSSGTELPKNLTLKQKLLIIYYLDNNKIFLLSQMDRVPTKIANLLSPLISFDNYNTRTDLADIMFNRSNAFTKSNLSVVLEVFKKSGLVSIVENISKDMLKAK